MSQQIQLRRDTAANWTANNPTLASGEIGVVTDTGAYKVGNGSTAWNSLSYRELAPAVQVLTFTNQADPSTPSSGTTNVWTKAISGRSMLKYKGSSGLDSPLQPAIFQNSLWLVQPNTTTSVSSIGGAVTSVGTISHPAAASNSFGVCTNFVSGAVAGNTAGTGQALAPLNLSNTAIANGGFFLVQRLWFPDANYGSGATGARFFVGATDQTLAVSVGADNPTGNRIGFAMSTALSETAWMFTTKNGTTETRTSTGMTFNVNTLYDFYVFVPPGGAAAYWRIDDLTNGTSQEGNTNATLPASTVYMRGGFQIATLTTTARNVRMKKIYIETDN
jgi:hypothetical protein